MSERDNNINKDDLWIEVSRGFHSRFLGYGPAWLTKDDHQSGQVGQCIRDTIRYKSFLDLLASRRITPEEYGELIES